MQIPNYCTPFFVISSIMVRFVLLLWEPHRQVLQIAELAVFVLLALHFLWMRRLESAMRNILFEQLCEKSGP